MVGIFQANTLRIQATMSVKGWPFFISIVLLGSASTASAAIMCPDGRYVLRGPCVMCPDGTFIGGGARCELAPDGHFVPETPQGPQMAPDGSFVPGGHGITMCPDETFVAGTRCIMTPDGNWLGQ